MRRAARRDANEPALIQLAREIGAVCINIQEPVDWLIGWRGRWYPCEVKTLKGDYTDQQVLFMGAAKERELQVWAWRTADDVMRSLGASIGAGPR